MRRLVMPVTIVRAGECRAAFIALVTNGWRRRGRLDGRPRGGRKRRRIRVLENSGRDERGRGDVLDLMAGLAVAVILLALLLLLWVHSGGLDRQRLWVAG